MTRSESNTLNLLLVQADLQWAAPRENRAHLESLVEADAANADLVILPETFTTGFLGDKGSESESMNGSTVVWMQALASSYGAVVTGSVAIDDQGRRNRLLWVTPEGQVRYYDKKHLFSFGGEDRQYAAGQAQATFECRGWRIRPVVCYDIRFPVWCRNRGDYDLLLVVANWPAARIGAWTALLRARAIENQCYVAAVNRVGVDGNGVAYNGHSVVLDPLGEPLLESGSDQAARLVTVDLQKLQEIRKKLPFLADADEFSLLG